MRHEERRLGQEDTPGREPEGSRRGRRNWGHPAPFQPLPTPGHTFPTLGVLEIHTVYLWL